MLVRSFLLILCISGGFVTPVHAQHTGPEVGQPYYTYYAPTDYGAHPQNTAIVQDNRGVMYFGNTAGVLEFDGVSWRLIQLPNKSRVTGLEMDSEGRIWVAGHKEMGYLAPDSLGQLAYVSLMEHVPEAENGLSQVWSVHTTPRGVYFREESRLFRWWMG